MRGLSAGPRLELLDRRLGVDLTRDDEQYGLPRLAPYEGGDDRLGGVGHAEEHRVPSVEACVHLREWLHGRQRGQQSAQIQPWPPSMNPARRVSRAGTLKRGRPRGWPCFACLTSV